MRSVYYIDDVNNDWDVVYMPNEPKDMSDVVKSILGVVEVKPFNKDNYEPAVLDDIFSVPVVCTIKSDENLYEAITVDDDIPHIYQVGSLTTDINGTIIPGLYKVRQIGFINVL